MTREQIIEILKRYELNDGGDCIIYTTEFEKFADEILALDQPKTEKKIDYSHLCCICHKNWVDSDLGFDTCNSCLTSI